MDTIFVSFLPFKKIMSSKSARKQTYKSEYSTRWPCIRPSKKDDFSVICTICSSEFSIAHGGANDIAIHVQRKKHVNLAKTRDATRSIDSFFGNKSEDYATIRSEALMANFLIEHNLPFALMDHYSDLVKKMFPDSRIAASFACKRTKATAVARTLGEVEKRNIVKKMKEPEVYFSMSTDGSSDRGADEQLYPILLRYFNDDPDVMQVTSVLLQIATTKDRSTGENIFRLLDESLKENSISWDKVVCFSADNAAVMMGKQRGTAAFIRNENPDVFTLGCVCHRLHLAAEKGASKLPFAPEDLLIKVYYYLEKSSKRHKDFKKFQVLCDVQTHHILRHVCTRWLSVERCLDRLLEQWLPLTLYFKSEAELEAAVSTRKRKSVGSSTTTQPKKQKVCHDGRATTQDSKLKHSGSLSTATKAKSSSSATLSASKKVHHSQKSSTALAEQSKSTSMVSTPSSSLPSAMKLFKIPRTSKKVTLPAAPSVAKTSSSGTLTSAMKTTSTATHVAEKSSSATITSAKKTTTHASSKSASSSSTFCPFRSAPSSSSHGGTTANAPPSTSKKKSSSTVSSKLCAGTKEGVSIAASTTSTSSKCTQGTSQATSKAAEISDKFQDRVKVYLLFIQHVIPSFTGLNLELQEEAPKIHLLHDKLQGLVRNLFVHFVKPAAMVNVSIYEVDYKSEQNQKADKDLIVGSAARKCLEKLTQEEQSQFYSSVRKYFLTVCTYIFDTFPLQDELLMHSRVANPKLRMEMSFSDVSYFVERFHFLQDKMDELELEFAHFQMDPLLSVDLDDRADNVWVQIRSIKDESDNFKFIFLPKLMLQLVLVISHSNASDERLFSLVRQNAHDFRPNLSTKTLSDILIRKVSATKPCHQSEFSNSVLDRCKKAASVYNK